MINISEDAPRYFSFYRSVDDLINEYFRVRQIEKQNKRGMAYDFPDVNTVKGSIPDTYPKPDDLTKVINNFQEFKQKIDSGGSFKKERIRLSEDKRFQFSFSLASKGLIRVVEYYNADIAIKYPTLFNSTGLAASDNTMVAGVVPAEQVESKPLANNTAYFYIVIDGVEYPLRQQQKGTAKMLEINPSAKLVQVDGGGMYYTEPTFFGDFSLVFSSTFKKSYLELPKKGGNARAVDIFIPFDMAVSALEGRISSAVPLILASEYFTQARIKVRINVMRPITIYDKGQKVSSIIAITVKDFQDPLDWNKMGILRGMSTAGGVMTEMNAAITAFRQGSYSRSTTNTGRIKETQSIDAYATDLLYDDEESLQNEFGRYKNWLREEVEQGRIKTPLVPKPLMLTFSTEGLLGAYFDSEVASGQARTPSGQDYVDRRVNLIRNNFLELIDVVDLYFNAKISEVVTRIKKRFDEEGKSNRDLKDYFIKLLGKLYRDLEPDSGRYASSTEELEESYKKYEDTLKSLKKEYERRGI